VTYVDQDLCTGCGLCVDACNRGAISVSGGVATIDEVLCTSCARCLDVCASGAIISVDTISEAPPSSVPARSPQAQPLRARTTPLSPAGSDAAAPAAASPAPAASARSRLEVAERILTGLLSFASFVFERRQSRVTGRSTGRAVSSVSGAAGLARSRGGSTAGYGRSGPRQIGGGGRGLHGGQGLGRAQRPGGGRGLGSGRGQGYRCRVNKRRST